MMATCSTRAQGFRYSAGCFIAPNELAGITLYNEVSNGPPTNLTKKLNLETVPLIGHSQNEKFDRALGRVLVEISREFHVRPGFCYYDDGASKNAGAAPVDRVPNTHGTVIFGLGLLADVLAISDGDIAVLAICAHEFAHIYQFETGEIQHLEQTLPFFCSELHADFMAGYFLRLFRDQHPSIGVQGVGRQFESMGSSDYMQSDFHGTKKQRVTAIEAGYSYADRNGRNVEAAAEEAYDHVSRYE